MSGSTIGGVVGGAIGFWIGGPAGAQVGWMIGSAVGGYVDPEVIKGQKLTDAQSVKVQEGAFIPFGYGTFVVGGNILQSGPLVETKHRERTGKGGGPVQETYSYTRTFAVGLCEGEVGGILRIWADGKLVYDVRDPAEWPDDADAIRAMAADSANFATGFTFYPGSETQDADPALEALDESWGGGVGNVPAYRGIAYVVFRDYDCTDRSGAVPQFRFEVSCCGTTTVTPHDVPWVHGFTGTTQSTYCIAVDGSVAWAAGQNNNLRLSIDGGRTWSGVDYSSLGWSLATPICAVFGSAGTWYIAKFDRIARGGLGSFSDLQAPLATISVGGGVWNAGAYYACAQSATDTIIFPALSQNIADLINLGAHGEARVVGLAPNGLLVGTDTGNIVDASGSVLYTHGTSTAFNGFASIGDTVLFSLTDGIVRSTDGGLTWAFTAGAGTRGVVSAQGVFYRALLTSIQQSYDGATWTTVDTSFTGNTTGTLICTDGASVLAVTTQGVTASLPTAYAMPDVSGWYVDLDGNVVGSSTTVTSACQADLAEVVADYCARVGIASTRYDVSALSGTPVRGFLTASLNSASDNIRALEQGFFFDFPEWGNYPDTFTMLRAVPRGGATAFTLTEDDFVWSDEDQFVRPQAVEFPRKLNLTSADVGAEYNATTQTAARETQNVKAVGELSVELPLATTRDEAAQIADKMLKVAWTEAEGTLERELPEEFSRYVPSDCFSYDSRRYRLQTAELGDGSVKIKGVRDRPSAYVSTATGTARLHPPPPSLGMRGPTVFAAMNLPSLRTQDNTPGMYVFVCGLLDGWAGCDLQLSTDGGTTYRSVATITAENTMGDLTAACGTSGDITARVYHRHTLESVTAAQLAARANAWAIVTSNVAEIGQSQNATDTGNAGEYTLSTSTRGELGTTAAAHNVGDRFVLLDHLNFIPLDVSLAGKTLYFRPVSLGTVSSRNTAYPVVFQPMFTSVTTTFRITEAGEQRLAEDGIYRQVE